MFRKNIFVSVLLVIVVLIFLLVVNICLSHNILDPHIFIQANDEGKIYVYTHNKCIFLLLSTLFSL